MRVVISIRDTACCTLLLGDFDPARPRGYSWPDGRPGIPQTCASPATPCALKKACEGRGNTHPSAVAAVLLSTRAMDNPSSCCCAGTAHQRDSAAGRLFVRPECFEGSSLPSLLSGGEGGGGAGHERREENRKLWANFSYLHGEEDEVDDYAARPNSGILLQERHRTGTSLVHPHRLRRFWRRHRPCRGSAVLLSCKRHSELRRFAFFFRTYQAKPHCLALWSLGRLGNFTTLGGCLEELSAPETQPTGRMSGFSGKGGKAKGSKAKGKGASSEEGSKVCGGDMFEIYCCLCGWHSESRN